MAMESPKEVSKKRKRRHGHVGEDVLKPKNSSSSSVLVASSTAELKGPATEETKKRRATHSTNGGGGGGEAVATFESPDKGGTLDESVEQRLLDLDKEEKTLGNGQIDDNNVDLPS